MNLTNRVDYHHKDLQSSVIAGRTVEVEVGGALCPYVNVLQISKAGYPDFGSARLGYNHNDPGGGVELERAESILPVGAAVRIFGVYDGGVGKAVLRRTALFSGYIEKIDTVVKPTFERVIITARDVSARLDRMTVFGRRVGQGSGFIKGAGTVFNEDGIGNRSDARISRNGRNYFAFASDVKDASSWKVAEVIEYLLCEYLYNVDIVWAGAGKLEVLTDGQVGRDIDLTGASVIGALRKCCKLSGIEFKFGCAETDKGLKEAIVFYKAGSVEINCQCKGEVFSLSRNDVVEFKNSKNGHVVTNRYIGMGDLKRFEATFDLVKAWDGGLESLDYETFSPLTNNDFKAVRNVYRKWCLNEAGDYSGQPYGQGDAFEFRGVFGSDDYVKSRRRFWPSVTVDKAGKSVGYHLEVSYDNGAIWRQYMKGFNVLLGQCGVWLSSEQLDHDTWFAALKGYLKFRITASVFSDERLCCEVADGPVNSAVEVVDDVSVLPRLFKYQKITSKSIFKNISGDDFSGADEADDTRALMEHTRKRCISADRVIEDIEVKVPYAAVGYDAGARVFVSPGSRDMFGAGVDDGNIFCIDKAVIDFEKQETVLAVKCLRSIEV